MGNKNIVKKNLKTFIIIMSLIILLIIGYVIYNNQIVCNQKNFKCVYGYCPNNSHITINDDIIRSKTELKDKVIVQLEKAKEYLMDNKQRDPEAYKYITVRDNVIYVNQNWKAQNEEWSRIDAEFKKNKTIEEYFDEEFFETNNIIVFTYSLYNGTRTVKYVRCKDRKAYIKFDYKDVYGGPYAASVGYCFIILDKNIDEYEFVN